MVTENQQCLQLDKTVLGTYDLPFWAPARATTATCTNIVGLEFKVVGIKPILCNYITLSFYDHFLQEIL